VTTRSSLFGRSRPARAAAAALGLVLLLGAPAARAVPTAIFKVSTFAELNKGEPKGTFISSKGEVVAGRDVTRTKATAMMFWTALQDGGTTYFGTGDDGAIVAVKNNVARKIATLKGVLVTALAAGPAGKIFAATMPDAKIVSVDIKSGAWQQIAKLPTQHVWALLHDARARVVYAASGSPGKIFSIPETGGAPQVYYDPDEKHLLCLARDAQGALLTGSSENAILYRVTGKGKGTALHDFDGTELKDIAVAANGTIYVAVNKFERKTSGLPRFDRADEGEDGTPLKMTPSAGKTQPKTRPQELRPGAKSGKGALFSIEPSGRVDQLFDLDSSYFTDLELDREETLWAGDGTQGKVYLVRPDRTVLTAFDLVERQALALAVRGAEQYIGTGDAGAVYRVSAGPGGAPGYTSQVFDAKFTSRWGQVIYQASNTIRVESRSGNTAKADKTWSGWVGAGDGKGTARISSPAARYLQLRMTWRAKQGGSLHSFTAYYAPQNQRARLTELTFAEGAKEKPRSMKTKIKWKVDNPDNDTLVYRLYYREEMGLLWRPLSGPDPVEKTEHEWDTEPIPDGYYRVKIIASDERDNPADTALTDSLISERLLVDNRKPELVGLAVKRPWVTGIARDSHSPIRRIEYSLDGKPWQMVGAIDGIFDSPTEAFRFKLPDDLATGTHVLAVRAIDEAENMGASQVRFTR
jgi:hypothetical protein